MAETCKTVQLSWAGRTGNRRIFDYEKDFEVVCKLKEAMTREAIDKELEKTKWPLSGLVGMVLRPGVLVDFTLKSKEAALKFPNLSAIWSQFKRFRRMQTQWSKLGSTSFHPGSQQSPFLNI